MLLDASVKTAACGFLTLIVVLQEIVDETDRYIDNLRLQRVNAALLTSNLPRHLRKCEPFTWGLLCGPSRVAPLTAAVPQPCASMVRRLCSLP